MNLFYSNDRISNPSARVDWIDIAKGISILLTIIGHCLSLGIYGNILRGVIFSFHMPLFFILSCVTYQCSENIFEFKKKRNKAFKHLIIPALVTFGIYLIWQFIHDPLLFTSPTFLKDNFYKILFASGVSTTYGAFKVPPLGIAWFFFALFLCRTIFDYLHLTIKDEHKLLICSIMLCLFGIQFGKTQILPFSLDIALAIMPLLYFGNYLKKYTSIISSKRQTLQKFFIFGLVWIITFFITYPDYEARTYLELAARRYDLFPICFICAIAGTLMISEGSILISSINCFASPLKYIGKNSIYLLCIHIIDYIYKFLWYCPDSQYLTAFKRTVINLIIFFLFMFLRKQFLKIFNKN